MISQFVCLFCLCWCCYCCYKGSRVSLVTTHVYVNHTLKLAFLKLRKWLIFVIICWKNKPYLLFMHSLYVVWIEKEPHLVIPLLCYSYILSQIYRNASENIFQRRKCMNAFKDIHVLTHWVWYKMAAIFQTTLSNEFLWMKIYKFRLKSDTIFS